MILHLSPLCCLSSLTQMIRASNKRWHRSAAAGERCLGTCAAMRSLSQATGSNVASTFLRLVVRLKTQRVHTGRVSVRLWLQIVLGFSVDSALWNLWEAKNVQSHQGEQSPVEIKF